MRQNPSLAPFNLLMELNLEFIDELSKMADRGSNSGTELQGQWSFPEPDANVQTMEWNPFFHQPQAVSTPPRATQVADLDSDSQESPDSYFENMSAKFSLILHRPIVYPTGVRSEFTPILSNFRMSTRHCQTIGRCGWQIR